MALGEWVGVLITAVEGEAVESFSAVSLAASGDLFEEVRLEDCWPRYAIGSHPSSFEWGLGEGDGLDFTLPPVSSDGEEVGSSELEALLDEEVSGV